MFKNATFFRIADGFALPAFDVLEPALQKARFVPCGATEPESFGWVPPRGGKGEVLAEFVGGHLLLKLCTEKRAVPSSAVKAAVDERVEQYKAETGNERGAEAVHASMIATSWAPRCQPRCPQRRCPHQLPAPASGRAASRPPCHCGSATGS